MSEFHFTVADHTLTLTQATQASLASGGAGTDVCCFAFDESWAGCARFAYFWREEAQKICVLLDESDACEIPQEVLMTDGVLYLGVASYSKSETGAYAPAVRRVTNVLGLPVVEGAAQGGLNAVVNYTGVGEQLLAEVSDTLRQAWTAAYGDQSQGIIGACTYCEMAQTADASAQSEARQAHEAAATAKDARDQAQTAAALAQQEMQKTSSFADIAQESAREAAVLATAAQTAANQAQASAAQTEQDRSTAAAQADRAQAAAGEAAQQAQAAQSTAQELLTAADEWAGALVQTTTRAKAHFLDDASDKPFARVSIYGEAGGASNPTLRVTGKNLIPHPYADTLSSRYGIQFTTDSEGRVTLRGTYSSTATGTKDWYLLGGGGTFVPIRPGVYTLSGCPAGGGMYKYRLFAHIKGAEGRVAYASDMGEGATFTAVEGDTIALSIRFGEEIGTVDGLTFCPQLERAAAATAFEPYTAQSVTVPYTLGEGDSVTAEKGAVRVSAGGVQTDVTDTDAGRALLALHGSLPYTNIFCGAPCEISYKADTTRAYEKLRQAVIALGGEIDV